MNEEDASMNITTTARHFKASPELIQHIRRRMEKLKRYFDNILNIDVTMSIEKIRNIAEVNLQVQGHFFSSAEESEDMYLTIDMCAKDLERQIKKYKGKLHSNHQNHKNSKRMLYPREFIIDAESVESENGIEMGEAAAYNLSDMTVREAIKAMEKQEKEYLLFNNIDTEALSFVYRRADGNYGVIRL
ncbi:MAG: ribosome-associated translation inhibitor RaiA [Candidatus Latescibacteria bacterium]|nr:ribosome-associated translation inhibitor RaiA [bacterium]MBD3424997.1 ribosome-associated translation inhibitor RaiA [Candidatus Latescibacterota bacterium]